MAKKERRQQCYSGIGGQAVLEGVMMRNRNLMAVSVRRPDGEIETAVEECHGIGEKTVWTKIPLLRGVLSFVDSLSLGLKATNFSASFYDEEEEEASDAGSGTPSGDAEEDAAGTSGEREGSGSKSAAQAQKKPKKPKEKKPKTPEQLEREEKFWDAAIMVIALVLAVLIFIALPSFLTGLLDGYIRNDAVMAILEGLIRLGVFLGYMLAISIMKDIRRLYRYHGAEHKCINCIESGRPLTVEYVMRSSRFHKRCGSSFIILVVIISIILFFFIRVDNYAQRLITRILLIPVIAGISFEFLRYAGRHNNIFVDVISAPGVWLQHLTVHEPDESMVEVAIASVEAVFDWRDYLKRTFGYTEEDIDVMIREGEDIGY